MKNNSAYSTDYKTIYFILDDTKTAKFWMKFLITVKPDS